MDIVMVDTAGRLPTQTNLMNELARIRKVQGKAMEGAPHEVILVLDGTNGQNALMQAKAFDESAGLTGLIITKLDGTAKGGVLVALANSRENRCRFITSGSERPLTTFSPSKRMNLPLRLSVWIRSAGQINEACSDRLGKQQLPFGNCPS